MVAQRDLVPAIWLPDPSIRRECELARYRQRSPSASVIDSSKFERPFGHFDATPHRDAVDRTVRWFRSRGA